MSKSAQNPPVALLAEGQVTMTSKEIADLVSMRHDNVMRDIRAMLVELHGEHRLLNFEETVERRNPSGGAAIKSPIYRLPKRETLILVSGYKLGLRARIIDRLQELEDAARQPATLTAPAMNLGPEGRFLAAWFETFGGVEVLARELIHIARLEVRNSREDRLIEAARFLPLGALLGGRPFRVGQYLHSLAGLEFDGYRLESRRADRANLWRVINLRPATHAPAEPRPLPAPEVPEELRALIGRTAHEMSFAAHQQITEYLTWRVTDCLRHQWPAERIQGLLSRVIGPAGEMVLVQAHQLHALTGVVAGMSVCMEAALDATHKLEQTLGRPLYSRPESPAAPPANR